MKDAECKKKAEIRRCYVAFVSVCLASRVAVVAAAWWSFLTLPCALACPSLCCVNGEDVNVYCESVWYLVVNWEWIFRLLRWQQLTCCLPPGRF